MITRTREERIENADVLIEMLIGTEQEDTRNDDASMILGEEEHYRSITKDGDLHSLSNLERSIEISKDSIAIEEVNVQFNKAVYKLSKNDDFRIFIDYYFETEKDRLAEMVTSAHAFDANTKDEITSKLDSIRHFKLFIKAAVSNGNDALPMIQGEKMNIDVIERAIEDGKYTAQIEKKGK
jgi:hypothetical protein